MANEEIQITDLPGVGTATSEKLAEAGYDTILSIAVAHPSNIMDAVGMSESVARKVIRGARDSMGMGFHDALTTEKEQKNRGFVISTGSKEFDNILAGGIKSGGITEVFGQYGSSKTQIAHQLCVNVLTQFPQGKVVFIDTEGTFTHIRIRQMSKGKGVDANDVMKRIMVAKAYNSDHQTLLAEQAEQFVKNDKNVKLIIVDSLMALFRAEYIGRGTLANRQQKINKHMRTLQKTADLYDIPVFVTNQVSASPAVFYGNPLQAIGGNIVAHNSRERIFLRPGKAGSRVAKLIDSPSLPDAEANYVVTEKGIEDV